MGVGQLLNFCLSRYAPRIPYIYKYRYQPYDRTKNLPRPLSCFEIPFDVVLAISTSQRTWRPVNPEAGPATYRDLSSAGGPWTVRPRIACPPPTTRHSGGATPCISISITPHHPLGFGSEPVDRETFERYPLQRSAWYAIFS